MYGNWENEEEQGIIPRTIQTMFQMINADNDFSYTVSISYLQIYMEMV